MGVRKNKPMGIGVCKSESRRMGVCKNKSRGIGEPFKSEPKGTSQSFKMNWEEWMFVKWKIICLVKQYLEGVNEWF